MSVDLLLLWYLSCRAVCVHCAPICLCWCCLLGFCPLTKAEEWKCPNAHSLWWKLSMSLQVFMSIVLLNMFTQHFVTSVATNLCLKQTCGISHFVLLKAVLVWVCPRLHSFSFFTQWGNLSVWTVLVQTVTHDAFCEYHPTQDLVFFSKGKSTAQNSIPPFAIISSQWTLSLLNGYKCVYYCLLPSKRKESLFVLKLSLFSLWKETFQWRFLD